MPLLKVRSDRLWTKELRTARGPKPVDVELWESEIHRMAIVKELQAAWIDEFKKVYGIEYAGGGMKVIPVTYVDYSGDATHDPGPLPPPHPQQVSEDKLRAFERAERARAKAVMSVDHSQPREVVGVKLEAWWWVPRQEIVTKPSSIARSA